MKLLPKVIPSIFAACVTILIMTSISCNKDSTPNATTTTKCVTCANGGTCLNDTCHCIAGYEGVACETLSTEKFVGEWSVFEKGTLTSSRDYEIEIQSNFNPLSIDSITINNFYDTFTVNIFAYVVVDSIYIPSQQVWGKTIVGKGYIHSDATGSADGEITMNYAVTDIASGKVDDFGYTSSADSPSLWSRF